MGSPPRMRGKALHFNPHRTGFGITPAYAGKSSRNETCWHRPWDHPCVCGEKVPITCVPKYALGSPPRVRGKALVFERERTEHRIIPACAGKRPRPRRWVRPPRDHPRVCGEKTEEQKERAEYLGSPLRVRGKGVDALGGCLSAGITPAYAGKSSSSPGIRTPVRDHPRMCGEKVILE